MLELLRRSTLIKQLVVELNCNPQSPIHTLAALIETYYTRFSEDSITGTSLQERAFRTILTSKLANLHQRLQQRVSKVLFEEVVSGDRTPDGKSSLLRHQSDI